MPGSIGAITESFKSAATKRYHEIPHNAKKKLWQRNYYEHIIWNESDYQAVYEYILTNPMNSEMDEENAFSQG